MLLGDKDYIECAVEFKIKGDNSWNDTKKTKESIGFSMWIIS